jgi:phosphate starvation-inducible membrane PsiE
MVRDLFSVPNRIAGSRSLIYVALTALTRLLISAVQRA